MFHIHKWTKWARSGGYTYYRGKKVSAEFQYRTCTKCGYSDVRGL